jgi:hypothetical protein
MLLLAAGALVVWMLLIAGFLALARAAALGDRAIQRATRPHLTLLDGQGQGPRGRSVAL